MALRDHDYVIPANHEEVGVPNLNLFLQDHNYAQRPAAIQIQEEQEGNQRQAEEKEEDQQQQQQGDQPQAEGEDQPQAEEQEDQPQAEEQEENQPQEEGEKEQQQARTYRTIPGIRLNSKFYVDNFGYKYYKKKLLINRIKALL
ncbi:ataxin-8-like [Aphis gossypii]|uniref:ataxin-8-like n=1 Tax=Aphis gossypii TaxID=80765 RepID=UPI002158B352|nr:ataxin-8-like [Aphis gossypii]